MDNSKFIYQILEIKYLKSNGREIDYNISNNDLYPNDWSLNDNYELKIKILKEALEKGIKIKETDSYQETIEGIRKSL